MRITWIRVPQKIFTCDLIFGFLAQFAFSCVFGIFMPLSRSISPGKKSPRQSIGFAFISDHGDHASVLKYTIMSLRLVFTNLINLGYFYGILHKRRGTYYANL
jgi:hypothetical protein